MNLRSLASMTIAISCLIGLSEGHAATSSVRSYTRTCRYEQPLTAYSGCNAHSGAGAWAADCATHEAITDCQVDRNADCVVQGARYRSIISRDFIGYKACEVTIHVTGYSSGR